MHKRTENEWDKDLETRFPEAKWFDDGFSVEHARQSDDSGEKFVSIVRKPWGREIWFYFLQNYAFKLLVIFSGKKFSKQYHEQKTESWLVQAGHPKIILGEETFMSEPGRLYHVAVQTVHRVEALEDDVELLEVSTPELHDVVRVEDDYNR